jgi:multidrug efflux pump
LFSEFALTLAGAVIVSGFVALTLAPMLSAKLLKHNPNPGAFYLYGEKVLNGLTSAYRSVLTKSLNLRYMVVLLAILTIFGVGYTFNHLPEELAPQEDRGVVIGFSIAPEGSSTEYVDKYAGQIEALYEKVPEKKTYFMITGFPDATNSISFLGLQDWEERQRSSKAIAGELMGPMFGGIPGVMSFPTLPPSLGQGIVSRPIEFVVQTTDSFENLDKIVQALMMKIYTNPIFSQPDVDLKLNKPELNIQVQRNKAADVGVPIATIGKTLEIMMASRDVTRFKKDGEQYDVVLQVEDVERSSPQDITQVYVRGNDNTMIQLSNLVTVTETVSPKQLNHFNKLNAATIQAGLAPGITADQGLAFLNESLKEIADEMGLQVQVDYGGQSREFLQSSAGLMSTFLLALAFIYLVLAAQFESFKSPFIIMLSVPPALLGALLTLVLVGGTLNVYSQIGLLTLVGLITKHGILIVEFSNQLQEQGKNKLTAVIEASTMRLRPILMTTFAMVLGAIPLALATGAGAESRSQIGWVIVGGMSFGTILTLFIVPAFYMLLASDIDAKEHEE